MKNMKRCFSILLALVMIFALAATAMATGEGGDTTGAGNTGSSTTPVTITAPNNSRTYEIYQIFSGDYANGKLSNVEWGVNSNPTTGDTIGDKVPEGVLTTLASTTGSDTEKLAVITNYINLGTTENPASPYKSVSNGASVEVTPGYYLIKDTGAVGDGEEYSLHVVEVVNSVIIEPKVGTTTSDKKVDDKNDSTNGEDTTSWQDSADYDIGDDVPFKLSATITGQYANYAKGYKLTFHDKQDTGLTFNQDSVKVKVGDTIIDSGYEVVTEGLTDDCTFEVRFTNLKDITSVAAGSVITVEYTSTLNQNAVIGAAGNKNISHITYTNNPNDEQAGENGKTPDDTVIVFTYKTVINKVDQNHKSLAGATFTLQKFIKGYTKEDGTVMPDSWKDIDVHTVEGEDASQKTSFEFRGLDDGIYKLTETVTPAGYNTIEPITFTVAATHHDGAEPRFGSLSGVENVPADAPTGYVALTFTPKDVDNEPALTADVVNKSGSTLPETGGMGTTVLYIVGGVLVAVAAVMLIVKRRMAAEK